jgi:hypothetical protein
LARTQREIEIIIIVSEDTSFLFLGYGPISICPASETTKWKERRQRTLFWSETIIAIFEPIELIFEFAMVGDCHRGTQKCAEAIRNGKITFALLSCSAWSRTANYRGP